MAQIEFEQGLEFLKWPPQFLVCDLFTPSLGFHEMRVIFFFFFATSPLVPRLRMAMPTGRMNLSELSNVIISYKMGLE